MWPLSIFLFVATAAPQQPQLNVFQDFRNLKLPVMQHWQFDDSLGRKLLEENRRNTCYTMRSYFFRRQDGPAPVPAGMTTCTPGERAPAKTSIPPTEREICSARRNARTPIDNLQPLANSPEHHESRPAVCFLRQFSHSINIGLVP